MFHHVFILAILTLTCSTNVKGDVIDDAKKSNIMKRHDGYVLDIWHFVKFLADVQTERKEQKKQLDTIEKLVKDLTKKTDNKDLTRKSTTQFTSIQKQIQTTKTSLTVLERKYTGIENQVELLKNQTVSPTIAFYAWLSKGDTRKNKIIKYDKITTNIGNGYNVNTGKFVAPVSGVYMFAVSVAGKYKVGQAHLDIMKNDQAVGVVRSEATKDLDTGSKVIILNLMASDVVYLQRYFDGDLWTDRNWAFNTFSGYLIKQTI